MADRMIHLKFIKQDELLDKFKDSEEGVPFVPFYVIFLPFTVRDGVEGYIVACSPDDPNREWKVPASMLGKSAIEIAKAIFDPPVKRLNMLLDKLKEKNASKRYTIEKLESILMYMENNG